MYLKKSFLLFISAFVAGCFLQNSEPLPNDFLLEQEISEILKTKNLPRLEKEDTLRTLISSFKQDTIRNAQLYKISYHFYKENDSLLFRRWNEKSRRFSLKLKDTSRVAESHWDLANFLHEKNLPDSAFINYHKAYRFYTSVNALNKAGIMLLNMAVIQKNVLDLTGSEKTSFEALKLAEDTSNDFLLNLIHNNLGIVYNEMQEYDKAIGHHKKALRYLESLKDPPIAKATALNNIGVIFKNQDKHNQALEYYEKALSTDSLLLKNPRLFAMLIDNRAYSKMLERDTSDIHKQFLRALRIRDSIGHLDGIVINKIHLSEYRALAGDTVEAFQYAQEANSLAKETFNNRDILESYLLLAKFDKSRNQEYFEKYIKLSDSVQWEERVMRNKFSRIQFETDRFMAENQKLYEQRDVLLGLTAGIALLGFSCLIIVNQRSRNRILVSKQKEQEATEKIYQLLHDQQNLKEEERQKERGRLSKELHDGILAKLFGLRLSLSSLNNEKDPKSIIQREAYLEDLKNLEKEIRQLSHELNSSIFNTTTNYVAVLEDVARKYHEAFTYRFSIDDEIDWERISSNVKVHLLRILQEGIRNISKHSRADHVIISIKLQQNELVMTITDDGMGFKNHGQNSGIGLQNMKSRAKDLGGSFNVKSVPNEGTSIKVRVPIILEIHEQ